MFKIFLSKPFIFAITLGIVLTLIFLPPVTFNASPLSPANRFEQLVLSASSYLGNVFSPSQTNDLSVNSIFAYESPFNQTLNTRADQIILIATGDVIPGRLVNVRMTSKNNFIYPFEKTADLLRTADTVFINLEAPLLTNCPVMPTGMVFCGDARTVQGLKFANVSVANLANNHAGNFGLEGIKSTVNILQTNGILVTGNGQSAIQMIKGKRFGFLGYNQIGGKENGLSWADPQVMKREISDLKKQVDFVVVAVHWGTEYVSVPSPSSINLAHLMIDSGADLVIGNHPHWVQGIEQYHGKFITYAHGNYVFDQMWSQPTREGVIGKYVFGNNGLISVKFYPTILEDSAQPRFANQKEAEKILGRMRDSTGEILKMQ